MTLVSIPSNPAPEDVVSGTIKTPDGAELRFARWAPPAGRKGTVCVFTGRSEMIEKYFETVRDLRDRGFAVAMIDWRGQGHSSRRLRDPRKGYVRDFSDFEVDVETFVQQVVLPDCPPPFFALAHSMGGAVMLRLAHAGKRWFDRMVLSAPMIDLPGRATSLPVRALLRTPFKIVQTPPVMAILYESRTTFRQILTDGRPLPKEVDWPAWNGFSVGRWEGDTFVAETIGFNGKPWLDQAGYPASDALKITERLRRRDFGHIDLEMVIDDRKMYTRPWSIFSELTLQVDTELLEFICEENEKDSQQLVGN